MTTRWIEKSNELLSVAEMYQADQAAMAGGVSGLDLMEAAGAAVAEIVQQGWPDGEIAVLCGPGNNGGDGFVAARLLAGAGRTVRLALLGSHDALKGDAGANAARWQGEIRELEPALIDGAAVVIDALFGAGLGRPIDGPAARTIEALNASDAACVAVDMPSGVHGDTGLVLGVAPQAAKTVTFFRRKPGHVLYPGRGLCGEVHVADIGIPEAVLAQINPSSRENLPALWQPSMPWPRSDGHKYHRGHAVIAGGAALTGAARLASYAALRIGAGLVTIAAPPQAGMVYRSGRPTIMVRDIADADAFETLVGEPRVSAVLVGPGNGVTDETADRVLRALAARPCVLDADALTVFADKADRLFDALAKGAGGTSVLTPHEGEFARLFDAPADAGKIARASAAAIAAQAVVLLKGADTVIAAPDGRVAINTNAPAYLATAGSGDVLAGFIVGLMAQGMAAYEAAGAAAWIHGACANAFGPGLIADDLADQIPQVFRGLLTTQ